MTRPHGPSWDMASVALLAGAMGLMAATFGDYGITNDEWLQHEYGERLLAFYTSGFADRRAFDFHNLYLYGGLFDLIAALLAPLSPLGEYDTRHFLSAVCGWLGLLGTWWLGRLAFGPSAGFFALVLLVLTGAWYGAQFNHTKDVSFATAMVWLLYCLCRILSLVPKPPVRLLVILGVTAALALGLRVGALLWGAPLAIALLVQAVRTQRTAGIRVAAKGLGAAVLALAPSLAIAIPLTAVFWPWVVAAPFNLAEAATAFASHPVPIGTLLAGEAMVSTEVPRYYLPVYLAVKVPMLALMGLVCATGLLLAGRLRARTSSDLVLLLSACLTPIVIVLVLKPSLYNGIRHFLFILPPLMCLAGAGISGFLANTRGRGAKSLVGIAIFCLVSLPLSDLMRLHPYQYVDYNPLIGDFESADDRWVMDYWSTTNPALIRHLATRLRDLHGGRDPDRVYRVWACSEPIQFSYYAPSFLEKTSRIAEADFAIATTHNGCDEWIEAPVLYRVERMGAVLGVLKDLKNHLSAAEEGRF